MAVWLIRVLDQTLPQGGTRFEDVDPDQWWAPYVERLAELGITRGCGHGDGPSRYCPDKSVTRAQMAVFLQRAYDLAAAAPAGFSDTVRSWAAADIDALYAAGITRGCDTGPLRYCPNKSVTRAQMAAFLNRARTR